MQHTANENNAARQFWDEQMQKHPGFYAFLLIVKGLVSYIGVVCNYVFNGHIILGAARWAITVGGRVATSILFFAALWVAGRSTEPLSMAHMMSMLPLGLKATQVDHMAILAFTLLPEVLLLGAGLTTIDQWVNVKRRGGQYWVWALIYSPLTAVFLGIAVYTFISFITGSAAVVSTVGKADTATIIRALAGWGYALLELIHAGVGTRYGHADEANTPAIDVQALIDQALAAQATQHEQQLRTLAAQQDQRLQLMDQEQQRLLATVQRIEDSISIMPAIDIQELITAAINDQEQRIRISIQEISEPLQIAAPSVESEALLQQVEALFEQKVEALQREALQPASSIDGEALLQQVDTLLNQKTASVKQAIEAGVKQQMQQVEAGVLHKVSDEINRLQRNVEKTLAGATPRPDEKGTQPEKKAASPAGKTPEGVPSNVLDFTQNLSREAVMQLIEADKKLLQLSDRALAKKVGTTASTARRAKTDYGMKHPEALQDINKESGEAVETEGLEAAQ